MNINKYSKFLRARVHGFPPSPIARGKVTGLRFGDNCGICEYSADVNAMMWMMGFILKISYVNSY
jgi:hypothetical protein